MNWLLIFLCICGAIGLYQGLKDYKKLPDKDKKKKDDFNFFIFYDGD